MLNYGLLTKYGAGLDGDNPLPEYPRPQLRRESYINLNGKWDYTVNKTGELTDSLDGQITVPFPMESCLSGVMKPLGRDEYLIYSREFEVAEGFLKDVTLLHIGAADQECEIFLNSVAVGGGQGGYLPVDANISNAVRPGLNRLIIKVRDTLSFDLPTGKQSQHRGGIWYTPISGIWQTVWLESVSRGYIKAVIITPDIDDKKVDITIDSDSAQFEITVTAGGEIIAKQTANGNRLTIEIPDHSLHLWSPENPFLYHLTVRAGEDEVTSYFAMRKFTVDGKRFYLNNKPYFINGLLDQGYFSDGIYTPGSYDAYRDDITAMKDLGFNTLRKHIKIEPMMFYYLCDSLGMLVMQDMVNVGKYSFFKDTILPMAGLRGRLPYVNVTARQKESFTQHAVKAVAYLYSCPSVVYYTIFNEGWGQFGGGKPYKLLKKADPTRVYDGTSGWFDDGHSDVKSLHIYFKPIKLEKYDKTVVVSEFGGYSHSCKGHVFNTDKEFGYRKYQDIKSFQDDFQSLYENEILGNIRNGLAGAIYTQLSDVEDETNGILTYDRAVCKLDAARVEPLMKRIMEESSK